MDQRPCLNPYRQSLRPVVHMKMCVNRAARRQSQRCHSATSTTWCKASSQDLASAAVAVSASETKRLMDAHIRFGHRNFRSLAKALNLRMPSKIPFCRACVEAKSTRHPKSVTPRPLREPAPRPGYRLHFDPFGPFPERLADGSFYGLLFADAYSTVLWFDTLPTLKDWFTHLKALILKRQTKVRNGLWLSWLPIQHQCSKNSYEYRRYADSKGIALLFSAPYTQSLTHQWSVRLGLWLIWLWLWHAMRTHRSDSCTWQ